jgi:hypothetical protein
MEWQDAVEMPGVVDVRDCQTLTVHGFELCC